MNHRRAQRLFADHLDGTLDPARRRRLDEHFESCGDCSDEFEGLEATVALLRALPEPEAPENLAESVLRRIAAGEAEPGFRLRLDRRLGALATALSSPRLALPVAAALAIVAVVGFGPDFRPGGPGMTPAVSAGSALTAVAPVTHRVALSEPIQLRSESMPEPQHYEAGPRGRLVLASTRSPQPGSIPSFAASPNRAPGAGPRAFRSTDDWIDVLIERPSNFAAKHAELTEIERELWVTILARRAVATEQIKALVRALRGSSEPTALALANDFEVLASRH